MTQRLGQTDNLDMRIGKNCITDKQTIEHKMKSIKPNIVIKEVKTTKNNKMGFNTHKLKAHRIITKDT